MADRGHELTEEQLKKLEKDIAREYQQATKEVREKFEAYMRETEAKRKVQEALYKAGKITKEEYQNWCFRHYMVGARWEAMRDVLASDFHNANKIALDIAKGRMPDIYALNANYATYQIEHDAQIDTGFTLYNHDTAEYLLTDERQLMPGPSTKKAKDIAENKDMQWNRQHIQSAVLQGILQGESPYDVAKRLQNVGQMNYNSAVRYARTMTTSAQNAGRYNSYRRAKGLGVDLTIEWQATLDGRTRHTHRMMHGQRRDVDEPFEVDGFKILYPAQSDGPGSSDIPQSLIWNCRCTLLAWVKGFEGDTVKSSPKMAGMSFDEWQKEKADYEKTKPHEGSRQEREKRAKIKENTNAVMKPQEDPKVVSWVKPIVGEHSRKQDILATNPNYGKGYEWNNNCQRCVTAYEARRRGYDVTALSLPGGNDDLYYGYGFALPYNKGERKVAPLWYLNGYKFASPEMRSFTSEQALATIENIMRGYGNGARAIIDGFWESSGTGHVFVCELVGGKVQFFDPQNGSMDCSGYIARMKPKALSIFRVDDLPFNDRIKDVFRNDI